MTDSLAKTADTFGLRRNYFFAVRRTNRPLFDLMNSFADTLLVSYPLYLTYVQQTLDVARANYIMLEHRRQKATFGKLLVEEEVYNSYQSYTSTSISLFAVERTIHYKLLMRIEKSNALFDQFLTDNPIKIG